MKRLLCVLLITVMAMTFYSSAAIEEKALNYDIRYSYTEGTPDIYESQNDNGFNFKSLILLNPSSYMAGQYNHNIHVQNDVDIIGFPVYESANCEIRLQGIPENCDYDLELYSANNTSTYIARSINGSNYDEQIQMNLAPGFYFVRVYSYMGYSDQSYRIEVRRYVN